MVLTRWRRCEPLDEGGNSHPNETGETACSQCYVRDVYVGINIGGGLHSWGVEEAPSLFGWTGYTRDGGIGNGCHEQRCLQMVDVAARRATTSCWEWNLRVVAIGHATVSR